LTRTSFSRKPSGGKVSNMEQLSDERLKLVRMELDSLRQFYVLDSDLYCVLIDAMSAVTELLDRRNMAH